ncbi:MAG: flagellar type III secretion system pore protein FliP [Oscillospiraceae bacterium]|nr:flagellar type III secretion system pore protein FliP [Oscillospiraceae bacterium]
MAASFPSVTAYAVSGPGDGTGIVTTIPNVETSVPQTEQVQPYQTAQPVQTDQNGQVVEGTEVTGTLPYNEPATDDRTSADNLLDQLGINESSTTIDLIILITILSLAPSILVMMTCFTRLIISFSLLRNAMGVQQTPPNQVMIGLALFLTLFIMNPVISEMNEVAYVPYKNGEYTSVEAVQAASVPLKKWMLQHTSNDSMSFFMGLTGVEVEAQTEEEFVDEIGFVTVVPAFILSEIKIGFEIGFLLYIPFLIIDIIVSTILMSMGMMMLPPTTVSIPFKLLLFILCDGWTLLIESLVSGFTT